MVLVHQEDTSKKTISCGTSDERFASHRLLVWAVSSCGGAVTDAAVAAFARGCRGLRRLCLRGVVGVPPPLGAPGILAVCCHCRELELLDLGEVWGLEDSALVGFHDHQMEKLEKARENECRFWWFTTTAVRGGEERPHLQTAEYQQKYTRPKHNARSLRGGGFVSHNKYSDTGSGVIRSATIAFTPDTCTGILRKVVCVPHNQENKCERRGSSLKMQRGNEAGRLTHLLTHPVRTYFGLHQLSSCQNLHTCSERRLLATLCLLSSRT